MEKEWVDVVDNIVKIGLPSLITGFVTIFGMKYSAKSTQDKFMLEHKVQVIEKISDDVDSFFNAWNMLNSKYGAISKMYDHGEEKLELTKAQISAIRERDKKLIDTWVGRQSSLAKLRLLKAEKVVNKLNDCINLEYNFRDKLFFDKEYIGYQAFSDLRVNIKESQKAFHQELAELYVSIAN